MRLHCWVSPVSDHTIVNLVYYGLRFLSWGLVINYEEGGYKMGTSLVQNILRPPNSRQGKGFYSFTHKSLQYFIIENLNHGHNT